MLDEQQNDKRTALVTGSSNGIGEAIVKELAKLDFKLVVTGRSLEDIERVAAECESLSPSRMRPLKVAADLGSEKDLERLFESSMAHFEGRLDLLVNNAGLCGHVSLDQPYECYENFKRTLQVNLNSACKLTLLAASALKETTQKYRDNRPTSVVNISSIASARPLEDFAYCISKCALSMLSNCQATQLAPLVRVNCINPGPIETKIIERGGKALDAFKAVMERMVPLERIGNAEEVAHSVVFLADAERASYITGAQLSIDGGAQWAQVKF